MKYVSWTCTLTARAPCMTPVRPPMEKRKMKVSAESSGAPRRDEGQREEQRRLEVDAALVEGGHPVEHLDGAGHGYDHRQQREGQLGNVAHARREHVVRPHQAAHAGDGYAGKGDGLVAEDGALGEGRS